MADGSVIVEVILDDGNVTNAVSNINNQLGGLEGSSQNAALGIGKIVAALGLVGLAKKGIDLVKNSLDGAFRRIDTFEQFERVMHAVTGSTEETAKALDRTNEIVTGTAYTLDGASKSVQNFVVRGSSIEEATRYIEAWGDAVAFYGNGSQEQFDTVSDALAKMLTKGTVEMDQLNRLFDVGIDAVGMYAQAVGRDAGEVQDDLSNKIITAEEFIDVVSTAMLEGTNGVIQVAGAAKEAGATWGSVFANMQTAVARGVAGIITSIDEMLASNGLPDMREMVAEFGVRFEAILKKVAEGIPVAVEMIKEIYNTLEPWLPLISSVSLAIIGMIAAWSTFNTVNNVIGRVKDSFKALNLVMRANPWLLIVGAIIAAAILVYTYWEPIKEFFINLWNAVKDASIGIWDSIKDAWSAAANAVKDSWDSVVGFFSDLWTGIVSIAVGVWDAVVDKWNQVANFFMNIFAPLISFFSTYFTTIYQTATTIFSTLSDSLTRIWNNIVTIASSVWTIIKNVILGPILLLINLVTGDMEEFKNNLAAIWGNIKEAAVAIWNAIVDTFITYVTAIVDVITTLFKSGIDIFVAAWEATKDTVVNVLEVLQTAVTNVIDGVSNTFENGMQSIKVVIDDTWRFIENLWLTVLRKIADAVGVNFKDIEYNVLVILDSVKQTIDTIWNHIRESFKNALAFLKALINLDFEGMKNAIKAQMERIKDTVTFIWSDIKDFFSSIIEVIKTVVKQKFTDIVNSVRNKMDESKSNVENGWKKAQAFLEGIDLMQIGKDIIQGLINGIKQKVKDVGNAVKDVADAITGKIKSILQIHSPSRVTTKLGENTTEGLAKGIKKKQKEAETAAKKAAQATAKRFKEAFDSAQYQFKMGKIDASAHIKSLEKIRSNYAKTSEQIRKIDLEILKVQQKHAKDSYATSKNYIEKLVRDNKVSLEGELALWEKVQNRYKNGTKERIDAEKQVSRVKAEIAKQDFANSKQWIERQKKYNEMSLMDELRSWERVQERYKAGSKERQEAEEQVYRVKKEIHDKLTSLNDEYFNKMQDVMQKEADEIRKLNDEYQKAVDDRTKSLYNFAGIFDEVKKQSDVSGQQLINNLKGQVETFAQWSENIKKLAERGIDEGLLAELRKMGPKAAAEIKALNSLSDSQLAQYSSLWQEKSMLAREQATYELVGMKEETEKQIGEVNKNSEKQLEQLRQEWETKIQQIRTGTKNEFNVMKADMHEISIQSMQGMINGLESMRGSLLAKARSIVAEVQSVMSKALDIRSPSRWMRDMIGRNMMLGWMQGIDAERTATLRKASEAAEWMKPDVPVVNRLRGVTAPIGNVMPISGAYNGGNSVTNHDSKSYNPTFNNYFTRDESTPSEVARKNKQQDQRYALEMGMI